MATCGSLEVCEKCKDRSPLCFRCKGEIWKSCTRCSGTGELTRQVQCYCALGGGSKGMGKSKGGKAGMSNSSQPRRDCQKCSGTGTVVFANPCRECEGQGMWQCAHCNGRGLFACGACGRGKVERSGNVKRVQALSCPRPEPGATIKRCTGTEESQVVKLWAERGCAQKVLAVWAIDNPYLTWRYRERRSELVQQLGREPAELRGFHGTHPANVLSIAEKGFDDSKRAGQAFGAGEYFAKNPSISVSYSKGGAFMFVCQLCLGHVSSTEGNLDGDHIWVPHCGYYVISRPAQALPLYIVQFETSSKPYGDKDSQPRLEAALAQKILRLGLTSDSRLIDLELGSTRKRVAALPAEWWNGDVNGFSGSLYFDSKNKHLATAIDAGLANGKVVIAFRGAGKFAAKVEQAQKAGAKALLIVQFSNSPPIVMTGIKGTDGAFPAAMISQDDGLHLINLCSFLEKYSSSSASTASSSSCSQPTAEIVQASRRGAHVELPPNRPCAMTATNTDALWLGYLHPHFADDQLAGDVRRFLASHAPTAQDPVIRIVRGKYTQAKVKLASALSRSDVRALNDKPFVECGTTRQVTVDDAHGSQGQRCPRNIAGFCRGRNLRFVDPCWCDHSALPTTGASFRLEDIDLESAKGDEIRHAFMHSAPFHDGHPRVSAIKAIHNARLAKQHEMFRRYLTEKNGEAPRQVELYHGTNMNILDTVYTHGLFPPSDMEASDACPVSGGKGLRTSLCNNDCKFCTERHAWGRCHMFGLGIYLGDMAQKSNRYVSGAPSRGERKLVLCSVLLGDALKVEGHLKAGSAMHDMFSLRALGAGDLEGMVESTCQECGDKRPADQKDILFVKGLGGCCRPGFSVVNSEYISFHPYQCLPLYEISYEVA